MGALFDAVPDVLEEPGWRGRAMQRLFQGLAYRLFGPAKAADLGVPRTAWRHAPRIVAPAMAGLGLLQVVAPRLARDARLRGMRLWLQVADYSDVEGEAAAGAWSMQRVENRG